MTSMLDALKKIAAKSDDAQPVAEVANEATSHPEPANVLTADAAVTASSAADDVDAHVADENQEPEERPVVTAGPSCETGDIQPASDAQDEEVEEDEESALESNQEHVADVHVADVHVADVVVPQEAEQPSDEALGFEQKFDRAAEHVDTLVNEYSEQEADSNAAVHDMQLDEAVAWQTHNETSPTEEPSFADQVAENQFDGDRYVEENLGPDHLAVEYSSPADDEPAFDPPIEPSPADFEPHDETLASPQENAIPPETEVPPADSDVADPDTQAAPDEAQRPTNETEDVATVDDEPVDDEPDDDEDFAPAEGENVSATDIGNIPRLYLNSPLRNAVVEHAEPERSRSFAERLIKIDGDGSLSPPDDVPEPEPLASDAERQVSESPAEEAPEPEHDAAEAATASEAEDTAEQDSDEFTVDSPADRLRLRLTSDQITALQNLKGVAAQAHAEAMQAQVETEPVDHDAGPAVATREPQAGHPSSASAASAPPGEDADQTAVDGQADAQAEAQATAAADPARPADHAEAPAAAAPAPAPSDGPPHADGDSESQSAEPETHVAVDLDTAVATPPRVGKSTTVPVEAVVEKPIVPRKSKKGRQPTPFEAEIRKFIFDPVVGTQIAEMFERVVEDCPAPGSFVLLSAQTESHVAEILGCMALVHALGNKKNVLLVDANLKKPLLSAGFDFAKSAGFADACAEKKHWKSVVQPTTTARLSILPAGSPLTELSDRSPVIPILAEMTEEYDMVMVDGGKADSQFALPLCHAVDRNYLLVRLGRTPRERAAAAVEGLRSQGIEIGGTIVTNVPVAEAQ